MAESSLSLTFTDMQTDVADYLNLTRTSGNWSTDDTARINRAINRGYRQFLYPAQIDKMHAHHWSFLRPKTTIPTVASDADYTLPDDLERIVGALTWPADTPYAPIEQTSDEAIRRWRQVDDSTGIPRHYAVRPVAGDGTSGQRFEMLLYPTPSSAWTLSYRYIMRPSALSNNNLYPIGGTEHGETILASALAMAELERHETKGARWAYFLERLIASINRDRDQYPANIGRSMAGLPGASRQGTSVRYNGVVIN